MNKDKLDQNDERIWIYLFNSLGLTFSEARYLFGKIENRIKELEINKINKIIWRK